MRSQVQSGEQVSSRQAVAPRSRRARLAGSRSNAGHNAKPGFLADWAAIDSSHFVVPPHLEDDFAVPCPPSERNPFLHAVTLDVLDGELPVREVTHNFPAHRFPSNLLLPFVHVTQETARMQARSRLTLRYECGNVGRGSEGQSAATGPAGDCQLPLPCYGTGHSNCHSAHPFGVADGSEGDSKKDAVWSQMGATSRRV